MKLVELDPRTLKPNPENYRGHPQEQIAEIATSLRDLGQFKNVVVRCPTEFEVNVDALP